METPQWMMNYCPRGFMPLNPVLRTADSLHMRQLPSVYTVYTALSIVAYQSVFGSALGSQIDFLFRCPSIGVQPAGQPLRVTVRYGADYFFIFQVSAFSKHVCF
jgi:hypothetical protein